ncbi:MAG: EamA/RhaT family transporter [Betaproteobacteria bacterium HGW-Betaproteobacteria-6]|jgi:drug/metabolite transporter (DMT)-like permease|nr:MAG: EamA/RhaT family transporter [Betaproteobacteria bacterium HGW-Betaproteobacteria-6]
MSCQLPINREIAAGGPPNLSPSVFLHPTALAFVALYGAGFVGARLGLPHAPPFAFLALRFAIAAGLLAILAKLFSAPWPRRAREYLDIATAGFLTVGVFSAGVFYSIAQGLAPAASALIIALQPILIAIAAPALLGERIGQRRWLGLLLGMSGVFLVLRQGIAGQAPTLLPVLLSVIGLLGLSAGNLYQKARCATMHPFSGGAIQCAVCAAACLIGTTLYEDAPIAWTGEFIVALLWMAVVVSVGAVSLLVVLIRDGEVSRVAGLFYLVPVSAAMCAWLLFGQQIGPAQWLGIGIAAVGVVLANRR